MRSRADTPQSLRFEMHALSWDVASLVLDETNAECRVKSVGFSLSRIK